MTSHEIWERSPKMNLKLKDIDDVEVAVTLWDQYAKAIDAYYKANIGEVHVVLHIQFGTFKIYKVFPQVLEDIQFLGKP
ncbi:hypothetical protein HanPSC8_Chr01g0015891 [Helianthus annuus]|nr:hypothetical protein HanPSC8_Chr01g0015891 [Helianthus annuus]